MERTGRAAYAQVFALAVARGKLQCQIMGQGGERYRESKGTEK